MSFFELPFHWYRRASPYRIFWLGLPILMYGWTVTGPFLSDDLNLVLKAERYIRGESDHLELYRFAKSDADWQQMRDRGICPWWVPPTGRLDFFRPVSELSFYLDVLLFGRNPLGYRLDSLAVFIIALLCIHRLFMKVGGDTVRAGAATFFFGISQTVTPPTTWMCNRQDLLVVIGTTLAATAYWQVCRRPQARHVFIAVAAFAFALLCKEVAVALAGVICLHELYVRVRPRTDARPGRRLAGVVALLLLLQVGCYFAYYVYSRPWAFDLSGADGSPTQLGSRLPLSLLLYSAVWTIGFPIDVLHAATEAQVFAVTGAAGALMLVTIFYLRRSLRGDPAAMFFILWAVLFILPGLRSLTASTRTLCTATLGWSYLVASLIAPSRAELTCAPLWFRQWLNAAMGIVSVGCAIGTVLYMNFAELKARERIQKTVASLSTPIQDGDAIIFDRAGSSFEMMCAGDRLEFLTGRRRVSVAFLLAPGVQASLLPEDDHTILAQAESSSLFDSLMHRLTLGPKWRPSVGKRFELSLFTAEITKTDNRGRVQAVRFRFHEPLISPRLHFDPPHLAFTSQARETRDGANP